MFDTQLEVHTKEAASVLATARCLMEGRGTLVLFPPIDPHETGRAVWSGLVTGLAGGLNHDRKELTYVTVLGCLPFCTSLTLKESMALVAGSLPAKRDQLHA